MRSTLAALGLLIVAVPPPAEASRYWNDGPKFESLLLGCFAKPGSSECTIDNAEWVTRWAHFETEKACRDIANTYLVQYFYGCGTDTKVICIERRGSR